MGDTGLCGSWVPCCPCAEHGWVTRIVCGLPRYHKGEHRNERLGLTWSRP